MNAPTFFIHPHDHPSIHPDLLSSKFFKPESNVHVRRTQIRFCRHLRYSRNLKWQILRLNVEAGVCQYWNFNLEDCAFSLQNTEMRVQALSGSIIRVAAAPFLSYKERRGGEEGICCQRKINSWFYSYSPARVSGRARLR